MLPYDEEDKNKLYKLVIAFRRKQDKAFANAPDTELARMMRDHLAAHDFIGHTMTGWYVVKSDDPADPIKDVVKRTWLLVDNKYIVDTCADRWHKEEPDNYKITIARVGTDKNYSPVRVSKSAAKFNAKIKGLLKFGRKDPSEGIST
jgi:hypothetical protein